MLAEDFWQIAEGFVEVPANLDSFLSNSIDEVCWEEVISINNFFNHQIVPITPAIITCSWCRSYNS